MVDGREYESILRYRPRAGRLQEELLRSVRDVENARGRPLLCYVANVTSPPAGVSTGIGPFDDLPFAEMVDSIDGAARAVDLFIATPGGSAEQVGSFVDKMRPRFRDVTVIIPYQAYSAGTLWALSGNEIIMDQRAVLGPIDPQVATTAGRLAPLQALHALVDYIDEKVAAAQTNKNPLPLAWLEVLRTIDKVELGYGITSSKYTARLAERWIYEHKFRDWGSHESSGKPVTDQEKRDRAHSIADKLASHSTWLSHAHGIRRDDLWTTLQIKVVPLESDPATFRAVRRLWGLLAWTFDKTPIAKIMLADSYSWFLQGGRK